MSNIKNILKNKNLWIAIIIICLIITYVISEKIINNDTEIVKESDSDIIENEENNVLVDLREESIDDIEETIITEDTNLEENGLETEQTLENEQVYKNSETSEKIYIYITGEVKSPGVVLLDSGSRIVDAIEAAGGVTDRANITKVNLVYVLQDGMKINIPNQNDLKNNENFEYITMSSGDAKDDANIDNSSTNINTGKTNSNNESAFKISTVNINTATQTELETLPGIGPSLALNIINYRKENGKFSSIEDIKNVSGIGEAKYENIKKNPKTKPPLRLFVFLFPSFLYVVCKLCGCQLVTIS